LIPFSSSPSGLTFAVRVTPRAGRTSIAGVRGHALAIRLAAAPVDGAANEALIAFLAATFDRPRRDVTIVSGQTSRDKRVAIAGLTESQFAQRLNDILST
jgi:uncharacterized protein (TIGR00251 family)